MERRPVDIPIYLNPVSMDFEKRRLYIASNSIIPSMISSLITALSFGTYGTSKYGRSRYGAIPGIYGYDSYGVCNYV